jgi:hypothetical protein
MIWFGLSGARSIVLYLLSAISLWLTILHPGLMVILV